MRQNFLFLLLLICLVAVATFLRVQNNQVEFELLDHSSKSFKAVEYPTFPISLDPKDELRFVTPMAPGFEKVALNVIVTAPAVMSIDAERWELRLSASNCNQASEGLIRCRIDYSRNTGAQSTVTFFADGHATSFQNITWEVLKVQRETALTSQRMLIVIGLLVVMIPVIWFTHANILVSQWLIIGTGVSALMILQPFFAVGLLVVLIAVYRLGVVIRTHRSWGVVLSILLAMLSVLLFYKTVVVALSETFATIPGISLILPLGLSYFLIRVIDTTLAWYRQQLLDISFREFLCYIIFPPTLAAGPIILAANFQKSRIEKLGLEDAKAGFCRIGIGIGKKIIIADLVLFPYLSQTMTLVAGDIGDASGYQIATLLYLSFFFAYIDFSAYSDIAIGLGRLYGYKVPENFNWPILQRNLRKYWERWHMTLSGWARQTIFIPSSLSSGSKYLPLYVTMISIGCWHALSPSWFLWGVHHATGLMVLALLEAKKIRIRSKFYERYGAPVQIFLTITFVAIGHSFVLFENPGTAIQLYLRAWSLLIGNW